MDRVEVGSVGHRPQGQVLFDHPLGRETTGGGNEELGTHGACRRKVCRSGEGGMTRLRMLGWRLLGLLRRSRMEQEMNEEIQSHLDMQAEDNERRGLAAEDARMAARRSFGNVDS